MVGKIIVWVVIVLVSALIFAFYNKLPKRLGRALTATVVFWASADLIVNYLRSNIPALKGSALTSLILLIGLIASFASFAFFIVYAIKSEEKQRKAFFAAAALIFGVCWFIGGLITTINGFNESVRNLPWNLNSNGEATGMTFSTHLCRQILYVFPVVYFAPQSVRKWLLSYVAVTAIIGGIITLAGNIDPGLKSIESGLSPFGTELRKWEEIDKIAAHLPLIWIPVILVTTKEVRPVLWCMIKYLVAGAVSSLLAFLCNLIEYWQSGIWGNAMYFREPAVEWFPTWALTLAVIFAGLVIILAFNIRFLYNYVKEHKKQKR